MIKPGSTAVMVPLNLITRQAGGFHKSIHIQEEIDTLYPEVEKQTLRLAPQTERALHHKRNIFGSSLDHSFGGPTTGRAFAALNQMANALRKTYKL